jgi:hypothetical protein
MSHSRAHVAFEGAMAVVTVASSSLLLVPMVAHDGSLDEWLDRVEIACMAIFWVDLAVRLSELGWRKFIRSPWCWFDLSVMILGSLPLLGHGLVMLRALRLARLAQFGRLARLVHLSRHVTSMRLMVRTGLHMARWAALLHWRVKFGRTAQLKIRL